jgi:predicted DNA-binding protein
VLHFYKNSKERKNKMPAKNPRINIILETSLYKNVQFLAEKDGMSLSSKARELIKEAMEIHEDIYLSALAEERERTFDITSAMTHEEVWS